MGDIEWKTDLETIRKKRPAVLCAVQTAFPWGEYFCRVLCTMISSEAIYPYLWIHSRQ